MVQKADITKIIKKFTPFEWTVISCIIIFLFFSIIINRGLIGIIVSLFITLLVAQRINKQINKMIKGEKESERGKRK